MSSQIPDAGALKAPATAEKDKSSTLVVLGFPLFILAGTGLAFMSPATFIPLTNYTTYFLMGIMFAMGLTLTIPDFKVIAQRPLPVFLGVLAQFVIMPCLALFVGWLLGLGPGLAVGLLMLGSVPGGTASNVITYLARGDVALSVAMTSVSTMVSPLMTPLLMLWLAGERTEVNGADMAWSLLETVLLPVIAGLVLRFYADRFVTRIEPALPWISIIGIGGVVFGAVGANAERLAQVGLIVFVAVLLHNLLGYVLGYFTGKLFRLPEASNRTMAVEIGTQSAGLASAMAGRFFSPEAAIPGAVAAVLHNITGAIYAAVMRSRSLEKPRPAAVAPVEKSASEPTRVQ